MLMFKDHTGTEHDFDALPAASRVGMIARARSHILGNEAASMVTGKIRNAIVAERNATRAEGAKELKPSDLKGADAKAAFSVYRADNEAKIEAWLREAQDVKISAIREGTLGVHVGGAGVDPLERQCLSIARSEIKALFKKQGWAFPMGDETFKMGANDFTGDELVDRWLDGTDKAGTFGKPGDENRPRIERDAKRLLKAKADAAKSVANADTTGLAESLGL